MENPEKFLTGGDLRSIGNAEKILPLIKNQNDFDKLFRHLLSDNRLIVMRAADAIEKITLNNPDYLTKHKNDLLKLIETAQDKELKWHLALIIIRLKLSYKELQKVHLKLSEWVQDQFESKIVRVNSLQSLHYITINDKKLRKDFESIINEIKKENIPSINARIKKLKNTQTL